MHQKHLGLLCDQLPVERSRAYHHLLLAENPRVVERHRFPNRACELNRKAKLAKFIRVLKGVDKPHDDMLVLDPARHVDRQAQARLG